ncbi:hypothetical protein ILUMI_09248 [Ignelater luminosus]|uniref:ATP-dependent DNA helicase PIF1 n=1 Tax=Ignelater luminosus TaxID=2038154 RepID=A0A8K0GEP9_IGNLU|nr:hypothetical protein ILUMI_09248 [Ignelater luminosus]
MVGEKNENPNVSLRTQLLSGKPRSFEEISPITEADIDKVKAKVSRTTNTTPSPSSRKRKFQGGDRDEKAPAAKKLYSQSPISNEQLTIEQQEVLDACLAGHNVFFTGSAGTGKSFLLRKIISALPPDVTTATASTGVAACHIGGITLHQFAAIGGGDATLERSYSMASKPLASQIWRKCKHLIIDEISMISANYFEKIEAVARHVRRSDKPFGGIQLIICGDFLQLPPVNRVNENLNKNNDRRFCFRTPAWDRCIQVCFELTQVHRQKDMGFINILNSIRLGNIPPEIAEKLMATSKQKIEQNGILATRLCSHTHEANVINESKLNELAGEEKVYDAQDSDPTSSKQLDQQTPVPGKLILKVGAQVMLLKNINITSGLVNGARGVVTGFRDGLPMVRFRNVEYMAKHERWLIKSPSGAISSRKQVPLRLAWAFSIHKSQGLTLDCVEMSLARVFEAGQAYVALSRAQSLETLRVLDFKASQVWADADVLKFYRDFKLRVEEMRLIPLGKKKSVPGIKVVKNKSKTKLLSGKLMSKPLVSIS